ncbi:MAG: hypothetical protein H5T64_09980 [Chloroflexi bacterium]|nr:hypothetical protein [Chloroflexota bacterium]
MIAIFQIIPLLILPPDLFRTASVRFLILPLVLFGLLAWGLVTYRKWARRLSIFVQGFHIIIRLLTLLPRAYIPHAAGGGPNWPWILTSVAAILLSGLFLYIIDQPEIQLVFEA